MGSQILFYLGLTLVVGPLLFIIIQAVKDYHRPNWQQEIYSCFLKQWNGTPGDELNAWYKVRRSLIERGAEEEEIKYVDHHIQSIDRSKYISNTYVTTEGQWVEERRARPYHNA